MADKVFIDSVDFNASGDIRIDGRMYEGEGKEPSKVYIVSYPEGTYRGILTPSGQSDRVKQDVELLRLSDLSKVMDKKGWKVAAALQREWFKRSALEMTAAEKSKRVEPRKSLDYINDGMLSYDWLMGHPRMNDYWRQLRDNLLSPNAKAAIIRKLKESGKLTEKVFQRGFGADFSSDRSLITKNRREFHEKWQFQVIPVDIAVHQQAARYMAGSDDLWAAFGGFSLYAALGDVTLYSPSKGWCAITLDNFVCYAIDTYEFIGDNQYLGHWNKNDIKVVPAAVVNDSTNNVSPPVIRKSSAELKKLYELYFCVRNEHFNQYRKMFGKGGDMLVWTKPALYKLGGEDFTFYVRKDVL